MTARYTITCPVCGCFASLQSFGTGQQVNISMGCGCALEVPAPMAKQMRQLADGDADVALCGWGAAVVRLERGASAQ